MPDMKMPTTGIIRSDIELIRHAQHTMLFDPGADAYYRVSTAALDIIAFMTEDMPINDFKEKLERNGMSVSLEEVISLVSFLRQNNLLVPVYGEINAKRHKIEEVKNSSKFIKLSSSILFFRLPPLRPEKFFSAIKPFISPAASRFFIIPLLIIAAAGYFLVFRKFPLIRETFSDTLSWAGLVKYFAAIIFLKIIHEAAHSISAIHFNCRVRGIGIGFMLFYPRLYTDTTDSWRLPRKQRILIDAAGIIVELIAGGIAALLWLNLPPGQAKSTMFYIFAVSTISTLLVNGNPFIRYDGYYILCDLVNIDNLMSRSAEYFKKCWRWIFLRIGSAPQEKNESFLLLFGISSFFYKIFLYTSIIVIIYLRFAKFPAMILLAFEIYSILIYPFIREVKTVKMLSASSANKARWLMCTAMIILIAAILFVPLSWNIYLPGEIVPESQIPANVAESGLLTHRFSKFPRQISKGGIIMKLDSPQLNFTIDKLRANLALNQAKYQQQTVDEKEFALKQITAEEIASDKIALNELLRRKELLTIKADRSGIFIPHLPELSPGAVIGKGTCAGENHSHKNIIFAYANDRDIRNIHAGNNAVIRLSDSLETVNAKVRKVNQTAAVLKPSPLLQNFGGTLPVYIAPDAETISPLQTLYQIELEFTEKKRPALFSPGRAVSVEIKHSEQLYKSAGKFILGFFRKEF